MDTGCIVCLCGVSEGPGLFSLSVTFQVKLGRFRNDPSTRQNKCVRHGEKCISVGAD